MLHQVQLHQLQLPMVGGWTNSLYHSLKTAFLQLGVHIQVLWTSPWHNYLISDGNFVCVIVYGNNISSKPSQGALNEREAS